MENVAYERVIWDQYAYNFLALMPSMMLELNKSVADLSVGNVFDFGCGAAKIAPFVLERQEVISYTGIDYSPRMVELAKWHLQQFPGKPSRILCGKIEALDVEPYEEEIASGLTVSIPRLDCDFALSINSYYSWNNPEETLEIIYKILKKEGSFVLVTPNPNVDVEKVLYEVKKEQVANPCFKGFKEQNIDLIGNENALFIHMDELIRQVQRVGFKVIEAHQRFYSGGINFLHLEK